MECNPFTKQGKALSCDVREIIIEKWSNVKSPVIYKNPNWRKADQLAIYKRGGVESGTTKHKSI